MLPLLARGHETYSQDTGGNKHDDPNETPDRGKWDYPENREYILTLSSGKTSPGATCLSPRHFANNAHLQFCGC